jgi:hypothetical protein
MRGDFEKEKARLRPEPQPRFIPLSLFAVKIVRSINARPARAGRRGRQE